MEIERTYRGAVRLSQGAILFSVLCFTPLLAFAQEGPVTAPPDAASFSVGQLQVAALRDGGYILSPGGDFGAAVGAAAVQKILAAAGAPTDQMRVDVAALLVRMPGHIVLLDTGLGPKLPGSLPESLKLAGVAPSAITDVLITHMHGDHAGGLLTDGTAVDSKPAFPNATIRMSGREWAYAQKIAPRATSLFASHVATFEPGSEILPGITPIALYGHTPGHVGYEIVSAGQRIEDVGDTVHSSIVDLAKPQWTGHIDDDLEAGAAVRTKELARLANAHELLFAPHFPFPGVGWVVRKGEGYAWVPKIRVGH
jgi:glyoxylase-like metal-dependent hydrolase (beta-lactamase superfamily II)